VTTATIDGDEYRPAGSVEFHESLGMPYKMISAEQIADEALKFVIQGKTSYGGRNYLKVAVRSWALGGGDRMVGWVPAPAGSAAATVAPAPATPTAAVPPTAPPSNVTAADVQLSGRFESFDRASRTLVLKDLIGASFEFAVRDDTILTTPTPTRLDEYLDANFNNHPWSQGQLLTIIWKPSPDSKRRIAVSIR
jgi:hypothetical protein